jgi:hypothetical protein
MTGLTQIEDGRNRRLTRPIKSRWGTFDIVGAEAGMLSRKLGVETSERGVGIFPD